MTVGGTARTSGRRRFAGGRRLTGAGGLAAALAAAAALSGCGVMTGHSSYAPAAPLPAASSPAGDASTEDPGAGSAHDTAEGSPEIPVGAMLRPGDLGDGYRAQKPDGAHWWLAFLLGECAEYQPDPDPPTAVASRSRILDDTAEHKPLQGVYEYVQRFDGDSASRKFDATRTALEDCSGSPGYHRYGLENADFTGDGSLLLKDDDGNHEVRYYAILRQGEVYAEIMFGIDGVTADQARRYAEKAAERLCGATEGC